ncbi:SEC-C metal-binding domain-containing protein [Thiothrix lacustris]|uniref:SEC-C metal-binding domain-containing protein n=1 Tax=Thiothrix lacustris TaxID=525917 RepID=A0ABY9MRQ3_9GAMM|nr:SEC-C metal-binding domain-containing protein [Thiothrix lacustris]WML90050.1 SEC-C metal-binding domain-containing protein [Thiothrix lacustris]WMP18352.1 SEC-C metal-binding domain-containing protein [Thiothrix lacustris]
MEKQNIIKVLAPLGEPKDNKPWRDYSSYGLTAADASTLVALVADSRFLESEGADYWVPLHSWRALQHLMPAGLHELIGIFDVLAEDDWAHDEIPFVVAAAKEAALDPLLDYVLDERNDEFAVPMALQSLVEIGKRYSKLRKPVIERLLYCLKHTSAADQGLKGLIVAELVSLRAVEAMPSIRAAFAEDVLDWSVCGDLEDVELGMGLRTTRDTPRPNYQQPEDGDAEFEDEEDDEPLVPQVIRTEPKIGRNEPCPCGSGKKYKKCCMQ